MFDIISIGEVLIDLTGNGLNEQNAYQFLRIPAVHRRIWRLRPAGLGPGLLYWEDRQGFFWKNYSQLPGAEWREHRILADR